MNSKICDAQILLDIDDTGVLDQHTQSAIKNFQIKMGMTPSGQLDDVTYKKIIERLGPLPEKTATQKVELAVDDSCTTDISETTSAYEFYTNMLSSDEYVTDYGKVPNKRYIFLHHTSGWNDPFNAVKDWENDKRGRIGTHYVIGGINIKNNDNQFDGDVVQCIPDEYFAWHLGSTSDHGINFEMHKTSIGIELCNFGWLTQKNGKFYTYTGQIVPEKYVCDLGYKFRGYQYWHKYTEKQLNSLEHLLTMLSTKYKINLAKGLKDRLSTMDPAKAFGLYPDAVSGKVQGLLSHTNVRKDKYDMFPQPELIELLKNL